MAEAEWVLATPALYTCETVQADDAEDAIGQAWVSGHLDHELNDLLAGTDAESLRSGYLVTYAFPEDCSVAPVAYELVLDYRLREEPSS